MPDKSAKGNRVGKYFGPRKIKNVVESKEKTYLGKIKLILSFEDGSEETYPLEVVEGLISETSIDLSELRDRRVKPVIEKLLVVLLESELTKEDLIYATGIKFTESLKGCEEKANEILWGKPNYQITLSDIDKILKKNKQKNGE